MYAPNLTNTSAKYSTDSGASWPACPKDKEGASASILLTTGAHEDFEIMNIYDIAGNVWEWTLEKTYSAGNRCAFRGGYYSNNGSYGPASYRNYGNATRSLFNIGFRVSLY